MTDPSIYQNLQRLNCSAATNETLTRDTLPRKSQGEKPRLAIAIIDKQQRATLTSRNDHSVDVRAMYARTGGACDSAESVESNH